MVSYVINLCWFTVFNQVQSQPLLKEPGLFQDDDDAIVQSKGARNEF